MMRFFSDLQPAVFYAWKDTVKNRKIFFFITLAIIFATANIIVVNGLMEGMINDLVDNTVETSSGHLNIYPNDEDKYIDGLGIKEQKLTTMDRIATHSPRIYASGVLSYKELSTSILIWGLDIEKEREVTRILEKLDRGESLDLSDRDAILVSYRLAEDLKLGVGDEATLAFENGEVKVYTIKGVLRTGNLDFDASTVVMTMDELKDQLNQDNKASVILIKLDDKMLAEKYKPKIIQELETPNIRTWKEEIQFILSFSEGWKSFTVVISAIGLIAVAISVGLIIYINAIQKKRQIGIMKSIGAKDSFIFKVFIMEAVIFGLIGVAFGDILGYIGTKYLETHPFYDAIMKTWISARFYSSIFYIASAISFSIVVLAGVYPAVKATRTDIIKAIWGR